MSQLLIVYVSKSDSLSSVIHSLCLADPVIFWMCCPVNFVVKNAFDSSGSVSTNSVLIVRVSAFSAVAFFGE